MSRMQGGPPTVPSETTAGTDGNITSPRVLEFTGSAWPVLVMNKTGNTRDIYVKINATDAFDFGGGSDDGTAYFGIPDGSAVDVSFGGLVSVDRVSFVTTNASDDLDDVEVHGWVVP